jgi:Anaerobic ribonucleoside-triphosphate reductase
MQTLSNVIELESDIVLTTEERQPCEVWTRVMGYHRPVSSFNRGKQGEFHERTCFSEAKLA